MTSRTDGAVGGEPPRGRLKRPKPPITPFSPSARTPFGPFSGLGWDPSTGSQRAPLLTPPYRGGRRIPLRSRSDSDTVFQCLHCRAQAPVCTVTGLGTGAVSDTSAKYRHLTLRSGRQRRLKHQANSWFLSPSPRISPRAPKVDCCVNCSSQQAHFIFARCGY